MAPVKLPHGVANSIRTAAVRRPSVQARRSFASMLLVALCTLAPRALAGDLDFTPPQFLPGDEADGLTDGQQTESDIAAGGPGFLAVWSDSRSSLFDLQGLEGSGYDVYACLMDANGDVLVRSIVIDEGPGHQIKPCVAWNGQHWLVAWVEQDPVGLPTYDRIRAVRVAADGTVVDPTPILVHEDDYYFSFEGPAMASAGADGWAILFKTNNAGIRAVRVASDGTVATPGGVLIANSTGVKDIVFAQDEYVIITGGSSSTPRFRRYSPTLQFLASKSLPFADKIATDGTNFLVVANNENLWPEKLQAVLLDHFGWTIVAPFTVKTGNAYGGPNGVGVGFDGTQYWVTWAGNGFARVTTSGQLLDPEGFTIPSVTDTFGYLPQYDTAPGGGLQFVWNDGGGGAGYPEDLYTGRLTPAGAMIDQEPTSFSAPAQVEVDMAAGPGVNMVVFRSRTSGNARILAQRVDDNGVALDPEPIEVASGPVQWLTTPSIDQPGVAWNGSVFMVTWSDTINVMARRMNPDGSFVDASPIVIMTGQLSAVGALGATFLVSGSTVGTNLLAGAIRVARVDGATGAVLDSPPITVGGASDRYPHIVTLGGRWLVVWEAVTYDPWSTSVFYAAGVVFVAADGTTTGPLATQLSRRPNVAVAGDRALLVAVDASVPGGTTDLDARILMADGTFLGPKFQLSTAVGEQLRPAAAWNGTEFIAAWEDKRNAAAYFDDRTDIYGSRVSADGVVLDPTGVPLASQSLSEMAPAFLSVGSTTLMAVLTLRSDTPLGTYRIGIQRADGDGPVIYCTAKTSSSGCDTSVSWTGPFAQPVSGAADYSVTAGSVQETMNGLLFASLAGAAALPFNGGTLCMNPPLKRGPIVTSGGTNPSGCGGAFSTLVNDGQVIPFGLDAGPGNTANYQYWYRDPQNGAGQLGTALSNAIELVFQ